MTETLLFKLKLIIDAPGGGEVIELRSQNSALISPDDRLRCVIPYAMHILRCQISFIDREAEK